MVWREPRNHVSDCYFSTIDVTGINRKNRNVLKYPDLELERCPVAHSVEYPVPVNAMLSVITILRYNYNDNDSTAAQES